MPLTTRLALPLALLLAPALLLAQQAPLPRTPHSREIRSRIVDLGSEDWGTREAARERLVEIGPEAIPQLQRAARDADPQRAGTARELLETLRWQVPEELRQVVDDALDDFPGLPLAKRQQALKDLLAHGHEAPGPVRTYLVTIARFDPDPQMRLSAAFGFLQLPRGEPRQDEKALEALADEDEGQPEVHYLRARLLRRLERTDEALAEVAQARRLAPNGREPLVLQADLLLDAGRPQEALAELEGPAKAAGGDLELQILLGEALALSGRTEEGLAILRGLLEQVQAQENEELTVRLGRAFLRAGLVDEARQVYKEALGRFPYSRELNVALADLLLEGGQTAEALGIYLNEMRYAQPGSALELQLRKQLGRVLREGGAGWAAEQDDLFADAHRGRRLRDVHLEVANWLRQRGMFAEAARELHLVVALSPGQPEPLILLGDVLRDGGDPAGARAAYEQAQTLKPDSPLVKARLQDLGPAQPAAAEEEDPGSFAYWETRVERAELQRSAESVSSGVPPPLVLGDRAVVPADGCSTVYGFDLADGRLLWTYTLEPPPPEEGALPEQIGLELVALLPVPSAVVAADDPARARSRRPLVAALANVYWRPANRSWRKARFQGLRAYLFDAERGDPVAVRELDDPDQVMFPPSPAVRRGRALGYTSRGRRLSLEQLDLVLHRPLWRAQVPRQSSLRTPLLVDDRVLVAWSRGVLAFDLQGQQVWRHDLTDAGQAEEEGEEEGEEPADLGSLSTGLVRWDQSVIFGTSEGELIRLSLKDGAASTLAKVGEHRLTGGLVVAGERLFVSERGGAVRALQLPGGQVLWTHPGPRAAARSLSWAGDALFAINGSQDAFADEEPLLQALDPESGAVIFQRPVTPPATLAAGAGQVVVASGGRDAPGGLRVIAATPAERIDAAAAALLELESAARDALAQKQYEVSSVLAREYVRRAGGVQTLNREQTALLARILAKSQREDEALDLIHEAEDLGQGHEDQAFWDGVLKELGLGQPVPELPPKQGQPPAGQPGASPSESPAASPAESPAASPAESPAASPPGPGEEQPQ